MTRAVKQWARGLTAALVNGAASGVVLVVVDPLSFNLQSGLGKLTTASALLGLLGMANYLKQSPIWADEDEPLDPRRLPQ